VGRFKQIEMRLMRQAVHPFAFLCLAAAVLFATACKPSAYEQINPEVSASQRGVVVRNKDSFNYPKTIVVVNGVYEAEVGDLAAGASVELPFDRFVSGGDGTPFDLSTTKLKYIRVKARFGDKISDKNFEVN
jgi:hypothetical protein